MSASAPSPDSNYDSAYEGGFGSAQTATDDQNTWSVLAHIGGLVGALTQIPFGGCVAPLAIWLTQREKGPVVEHHAREALNFQLTVSIVYASAYVVAFMTLGLALLAVIPLMLLGAVYLIVASIMAAVAASDGRPARYMANFNLIGPWRPDNIG